MILSTSRTYKIPASKKLTYDVGPARVDPAKPGRVILGTTSYVGQAKSSIFSESWSKTQNGDLNRIYPSRSHSQTAEMFPLTQNRIYCFL